MKEIPFIYQSAIAITLLSTGCYRVDTDADIHVDAGIDAQMDPGVDPPMDTGVDTHRDTDTDTDTSGNAGTDPKSPCRYKCVDNRQFCGERGSHHHVEMFCPGNRICCEYYWDGPRWQCLICENL